MTKYQQLSALLESAAEICEVPEMDILYKDTRKRNLTDARHIICHIASRVAHLQFPLLIFAQVTNRADHSGTLHSCYKATDLLFVDYSFREKYNNVISRFNEKLSQLNQPA